VLIWVPLEGGSLVCLLDLILCGFFAHLQDLIVILALRFFKFQFRILQFLTQARECYKGCYQKFDLHGSRVLTLSRSRTASSKFSIIMYSSDLLTIALVYSSFKSIAAFKSLRAASL
jgi:hypothetical protein